jgi:hypothetical protein
MNFADFSTEEFLPVPDTVTYSGINTSSSINQENETVHGCCASHFCVAIYAKALANELYCFQGTSSSVACNTISFEAETQPATDCASGSQLLDKSLR